MNAPLAAPLAAQLRKGAAASLETDIEALKVMYRTLHKFFISYSEYMTPVF